MCAQFAPVAPPELLWHLKRASRHILGNYHLILAHDVAARPDMYFCLFPPGAFIIMDNSVIELGTPVSREVMKEACRIVPPKMIVLPDKIRDKQFTLQASIAGKDEWKEVKPPGCKWMCVPQGNNWDELTSCAAMLQASLGAQLGMWGVGRFVTELLGTRQSLVEHLFHHQRIASYAGFIHLLGFSSDMQDDYQACHKSGVLGIDSAVPLRMGQRGKVLTLDQVDPGPRGNWWEEAHADVSPVTLANLYLIRSWIQPSVGEAADYALSASSWGTGATETLTDHGDRVRGSM